MHAKELQPLGNYLNNSLVRHIPILVRCSDIATGTLTTVLMTDFWERMGIALGADYAASWAHDQVISSLHGRTVEQALVEGEDTKLVWRAVHSELNLPASTR